LEVVWNLLLVKTLKLLLVDVYPPMELFPEGLDREESLIAAPVFLMFWKLKPAVLEESWFSKDI
jgi:hypothetical protein